MRRVGVPLVGLLLGLVLGACTEKPQTTTVRKADMEPFQGASNDGFVAPGGKVGDQASWEQQMRTRAQGQNEYTRTPPTQAPAR